MYFDEIEIGSEIPLLTLHPDSTLLVKWACAAGDFYPIHFDKDFAQSQGLPGVVVHGDLMFSSLTRMLVEWTEDKGLVKKVGVSYRHIVSPNQDLQCKGRVIKKYSSDDGNIVECEIWIEDEKRNKVVTGDSVICFPKSKNGSVS